MNFIYWAGLFIIAVLAAAVAAHRGIEMTPRRWAAFISAALLLTAGAAMSVCVQSVSSLQLESEAPKQLARMAGVLQWFFVAGLLFVVLTELFRWKLPAFAQSRWGGVRLRRDEHWALIYLIAVGGTFFLVASTAAWGAGSVVAGVVGDM